MCGRPGRVGPVVSTVQSYQSSDNGSHDERTSLCLRAAKFYGLETLGLKLLENPLSFQIW